MSTRLFALDSRQRRRFQQDPFVQLEGPPDARIYTGYCIDLLDWLVNTTKFTYELYIVPDGKFGASEQSSIWNGMIGQLIDGE